VKFKNDKTALAAFEKISTNKICGHKLGVRYKKDKVESSEDK